MSFTDNFQRADGPIGSNYNAGTPIRVLGGRAGYATSTAVCACIAESSAGQQDASILFDPTVGTSYQTSPIVKANDTASAFYYVGMTGTPGGYTAAIVRAGTGGGTLASGQANITLSNPSTYRLVYNAGNIFFYINGVLYAWGRDTVLDGNTRTGFRTIASTWAVISFTTETAQPATFSVSPSWVLANSPATFLSLTGYATSWTAGTPGSPTFTVNNGVLSGQAVSGPTDASAWYAAPATPGTAVITDPSTGLTAQLTISASPLPPGGVGFLPKLTDNGAAIINRAGETPPVDGVRVWTNQDVVTTSPIVMNQNDALRYIVQYIWFLAGGPAPDGGVNASALLMEWVSGGYTRGPFIDTAPSNTSLKQDLAAALSSLGDLGAQLTGAVDLLGGDSPILSHRDLKIAIDGIQTGGDNSAVLDALAAIRGDTTTSLYTLLSSLAGIRTVHSYNLQDILDAIHLLPTSLDGGYTTADRLANAAGFVGVLAAIAALATVEAEDAAASSGSLAGILALATELAGGVASILAMLESLKALLGGGANEYRVPVWPGEAHVEWGEAIAIESNEPVIGEMHGVVVSITGCEKGTRLFGYDGITCYSHVGALGFCSDLGHMEPFQALGPTTAIYTVKTMASAFACRLFRGRNVKGTIRPWKIKAG